MFAKKKSCDHPLYTPAVDPLVPTVKFGLLQRFEKAQEFLESILNKMDLKFTKKFVKTDTQRPDPYNDFVFWLKYDITDSASDVAFVCRLLEADQDDSIFDTIQSCDHVYHTTITIFEAASESSTNYLRLVKLFHGTKDLLLEIQPEDDRQCEEPEATEETKVAKETEAADEVHDQKKQKVN
jgi:hypothetical protein